jgi:hypothetical protein
MKLKLQQQDHLVLLDRSPASPKVSKSRGQHSRMVLYRYTDTKEAKSIVRGQFEFRRITKWLNLLSIISGFERPTFITKRSILNQQKLSEQLPTDTPADISSGLEELGIKAVSRKQECPNFLRQSGLV